MSIIGNQFPTIPPPRPRSTTELVPRDQVVRTGPGLDPDVLRLRSLHKQTAPDLTPTPLPGSHYRTGTEPSDGCPQLNAYPGKRYQTVELD